MERLAQARAWAEKIAALFRADEPLPGTAANGLGLNEAKGKYAMLPGSASKIWWLSASRRLSAAAGICNFMGNQWVAPPFATDKEFFRAV